MQYATQRVIPLFLVICMCLFQSVKFTMLHMEQVNSVLCMNYPMLETQHMFCYGQAVQKLKLNGEAQAYCGEIVSPYVALIKLSL